uniref:Uncharacterized protein n=1 Tax=Arundo donax TaxID=35708 RepID=A0A0A9F2M9_ARUDO
MKDPARQDTGRTRIPSCADTCFGRQCFNQKRRTSNPGCPASRKVTKRRRALTKL